MEKPPLLFLDGRTCDLVQVGAQGASDYARYIGKGCVCIVCASEGTRLLSALVPEGADVHGPKPQAKLSPVLACLTCLQCK